MHHIYANSVICLIALAGTDANHGLRGIQGVSAPRHVEQLIFDMADGERFSWFAEPRRQLIDDSMLCNQKPRAVEGSSYNERGWTYQENVFAKRRLIFTGGPLRWICGRANWNEESYGKMDLADGLPTWWMQNPGPNLQLLQHAANRFNTRYFTYNADTLRAFLGIQNHIGRDFLGGLNYGHPEIFFDISLLWRGGLTARLSSKRRLSDAANSDPPSWSWMGWQGQFYFDIDQEFQLWPWAEYQVGFTRSVAQWYTMHSPQAAASDMRPVKCRWQICRTAVENASTHIPIGWKKGAVDEDGAEQCYRRVLGSQGTDENFGSLRFDWDQYKFRYPLPLPSSTVATKPIEQRPFIFARTTRSFLVARGLVKSDLQPRWDTRVEHLLGLFSRDGECAGLLQLHHALDASCSAVELVAVVKGWTTAFSKYFVAFHGREEPSSTQRPTTTDDESYDSREESMDIQSPAGSDDESYGSREESVDLQSPVGSDDESYGSREMRHSCYFVLCVTWENGVARRQGMGMVEADIWERNQEPVDLTLG